MPIKSLAYIPFIDGLRAIAVLSVVFYHFLPSLIPNGFIGVDIFFVISGYLITKIIINDISLQKFSIINFLERRVNRLFPALILVLCSTILASFFFLYKDEIELIGKHIFSSAFYFSNFVYYFESGYFDKEAILKPLLHLWSLSIEEQFYILWPLVIIICNKFRISLIFCIFLLISVSIFCLFFYANKLNSNAIFFLPQSRAWELLVGSLAAYIHINYPTKIKSINYSQFLSLAGLGIVLFGFYYNISTNEAYKVVLLSVIGTFLIIVFMTKENLIHNFLSHKYLVFLGKVSYPFYLWHWPILSFFVLLNGDVSVLSSIPLIFLSFCLACFTYLFVEQNIRDKKSRAISILLIFLVFIIGIFGLGLNKYKYTYQNYLSSSLNYTAKWPKIIHDCGITEEIKNKIAFCFKDSRDPIKYAMLGDSKAGSLIYGVISSSDNTGRWLMIGGANDYGAPAPFITTNKMYEKNQEMIKAAIKAINDNKKIEYVVIVTAARAIGKYGNVKTWDLAPIANYDAGEAGLKKVVKLLLDKNKKIVLVVDNPPLLNEEQCRKRIFDFSSAKLDDNCRMSKQKYLDLRTKYLGVLKRVKELNTEKIKIFDTQDIYFEKSNFFERQIDGYDSFHDSDHISQYLAYKVGVQLNLFLKQIEDDDDI